MSAYWEQIHCAAKEIDIEFWKAPEVVTVPDDELTFLLVPDVVEALAVFEVAQQVHRYQLKQGQGGAPITQALMATMGGLLPGILLYDHLAQGHFSDTPHIEFGTIGISLYKGPNERYDNPRIKHDISISVENEIVLLIDDLGDRGDTMQFLANYVAEKGAESVLTLALYMKPMATRNLPADFFFGQVPQDTWIITPRETVETMVKRVPVWKERGASEVECYRRLVDVIGYSRPLVDFYLQQIFNAR